MNPFNSVFSLLIFLAAFWGGIVEVRASNSPPELLQTVFNDIQDKTGYRFLYREAHVEGIRISFAYSVDWAADLQSQLQPLGLALRINHRRRQVVVYRTKPLEATDRELHARDEHFTEPRLVIAPGIVVTGTVFRSVSDSLRAVMLQTARFGPLSESNALRAMQQLPAVTAGGSLSDGIFVRGTSDDAFQVLLDGAMVYNRSHLFGLIDSFNSDVIRTSALYYDTTPARFQGPPGGVLSLTTRTGSLHTLQGSAAVTTSSVRGSIDGPIRAGRSSWLLAARTSLLNQVDVFGSSEMVAWGLDVNRPSSLDEIPGQRTVTGRGFDASFYDLHGKIYIELNRSARLTLAGYSGFNETRQEADRLIRGSFTTFPTTGSGSDVFSLQLFGTERFETANSWGGNTFSTRLDYQTPSRTNIALSAGFSYFLTEFSKEDFTYQRPGGGVDPILFISPFRNASELNHGYINLDVEPGEMRNVRAGIAHHRHRTAYLEQSLNRDEFFSVTDSWLHEAYIEHNWSHDDLFELNSGLRIHLFTNGDYLRASPRLSMLLLPESRIPFSLGYAVTHQFMHKLGFYNATTSDMWIQANAGQPPTRAETISGGMSARLWRGASISTEAYLRWQRHLRLHEINIQQIERPLEGSPWYTGNDGFSRGLELMLVQDFGLAQLMQSYTWSESRLRNDIIGSGDWFYAGFDRRHQSTTTLLLQPGQGLVASISYFAATGVPDRLDFQGTTAQQRMGAYLRLDASIRYEYVMPTTRRSGSETRVELQLGMYNILNRANPWYSDAVQLVRDEGPWARLVSGQAVVYDLGIQPSASLRVVF